MDSANMLINEVGFPITLRLTEMYNTIKPDNRNGLLPPTRNIHHIQVRSYLWVSNSPTLHKPLPGL